MSANYSLDFTSGNKVKIPLDQLNSEQRKAVETTEGPLLVLAGAGTGKTRVLTTRIANILSSNLAFPSQILAVTFTNKAAKEMRERVEQMLGAGQASGLWLGTFHSICLRILRRHAHLANLKENFSIIDPDDQVRLVKQILAENNIDDKRFPPKLISAIIQSWKDRAKTPEQVDDNDATIRKLYQIYQSRLITLNVVDFGDLLLHTINILKNNPDVLAEYHRRFRYILVDEYQDTNVAQYLWLRLLAQANHNICCVGDDDQSIYGWRGAEVENILRFEKDFENANVIRLEKNYRSTPDILAVASSIIANNKSRLGKTLYSEKPDGKKVRVVSVWDENAEAAMVGQEVEALQQIKKSTLNEIAILVRAGFQTRSFEECFVSMGIPYKVVGGMRFYERMEIRDAIAYMRVLAQSSNDLALERIINLPKRGIGDTTIDSLRESARGKNIPLYDEIKNLLVQGGLKPRVANALSALFTQFARWIEMLAVKPHYEVVDQMLKESGYIDMWKAEKTVEAEGRVENLKELISALEEFDNLEHFLEHVSLVTDGDDRPDTDMLSIMTMHGAKGLEFETVFLTGWEEGLFPSQKTIDESGESGLEEERRLAYVGITRAKKNLTISFAANRRIYGQWLTSIPSRFIDELPSGNVEIVNTGGPRYNPHSQKPTYGQKKTFVPAAPAQNKVEVQVGKFRKGERVFHQKFGYGRVANISGKHLTISFEKASTKTILEDFVDKA